MTGRSVAAGLTCALAMVFSAPAQAQRYGDPARRQEYEVVSSLEADIMPHLSELTGLEPGAPVPIEVWTRAELSAYADSVGPSSFPNDEWERMGRSLAEFGLVPRNTNLQEEFLTLLSEQAGAGYETRKKVYITLLDAPPSLKEPSMRRMVAAHELTHALQDRVLDLESLFVRDLTNLDRGFALRCVYEGMASVAMLALEREISLAELPDVGSYMRRTFTRSAEDLTQVGRAAPPRLLLDYLFQPYVVGSTFVQRVPETRPEQSLADLLRALPVSSEQVLHIDKYLEWDLPSEIVLDPIVDRVPTDWMLYHINSLGEHDLRLLGEIHGLSSIEIDRAAAGWDGFRFAAFLDSTGSVATAGASSWDSREDAAEFEAMFGPILRRLHGPDRFLIIREGREVRFATGFDRITSEKILSTTPSSGVDSPHGGIGERFRGPRIQRTWLLPVESGATRATVDQEGSSGREATPPPRTHGP